MLYTNTDFVMNKRSELRLFSVIAREGADIVCITESLPKNHSGRVEPVKLQSQDYDCFHNMGQGQYRRGIAMWVKKKLELNL